MAPFALRDSCLEVLTCRKYEEAGDVFWGPIEMGKLDVGGWEGTDVFRCGTGGLKTPFQVVRKRYIFRMKKKSGFSSRKKSEVLPVFLFDSLLATKASLYTQTDFCVRSVFYSNKLTSRVFIILFLGVCDIKLVTKKATLRSWWPPPSQVTDPIGIFSPITRLYCGNPRSLWNTYQVTWGGTPLTWLWEEIPTSDDSVLSLWTTWFTIPSRDHSNF